MQGVTKRSVAAGDVGLTDWPEPEPRPGTVVVQVAATGICGTDLHRDRGLRTATYRVSMQTKIPGGKWLA